MDREDREATGDVVVIIGPLYVGPFIVPIEDVDV